MKKNNETESYGRFDFIGKSVFFGGISIVLTVVGLIYLAINGINYGIDFSGGTEMQVKFANETSIEQLRAVVDKQNFKSAGIQAFQGSHEYVISFQTLEGKNDSETNDIQHKAVEDLKSAINTELASGGPEILRVDSVGPQVGAELKRNGFLSVFYSLLMILIYIALRFDYKYSPGAVICLFHDAVITLAIYVFVGKEVNVPVMAAILTLIGYSLNDTIVVFDRIRETEGLYRDRGMSFIINKALNDMLARTLITSGTTLVSSLALYFFADGTVSDIAFALSIGIVLGVYSSIYVAAQSILVIDRIRELRKAA